MIFRGSYVSMDSGRLSGVITKKYLSGAVVICSCSHVLKIVLMLNKKGKEGFFLMNQQNFTELLRANAYPGRGILLGRAPDGESMTAVYFIMGRSSSSRNRVFVSTSDGIRTQAYDTSAMERPELLIYHPVRTCRGNLIVTNGDQTDTIYNALSAACDTSGNARSNAYDALSDNVSNAGEIFTQALRTRTFEPDAPHYTPRISGMITAQGNIHLSVLKTAGGNPEISQRNFFEYGNPGAGEGYFVHTYRNDGNPLPSFEGEPVRVKVDAPDARTLAECVWDALNVDNRVSLFVRYVRNGGKCDDVIINRHGNAQT